MTHLEPSQPLAVAAPKTIAIVAPARRITEETAIRVEALSAALFGARAPRLKFHPQCFQSHGHFAGDDATRTRAFVETANDPAVDAVWFARGGYGSCRLDARAFDALGAAARRKVYLGYSDAGIVLGRLYRDRIGTSVHGPMPSDIDRTDGEAAVARALRWLVDDDGQALAARPAGPVVAFNATVLAHLVATDWAPDLAGHVIMLEDVGEYLYRLDRAFFSIFSSAVCKGAAGVMLGRISEIPPNDVDFGEDAESAVKGWCSRAGISYLGPADIGHDPGNHVVVFGADARTA